MKSGRALQSLRSAPADLKELIGAESAAVARVEELKATNEYRRVEKRRWNNGTRQAPRWEWMVLAWKVTK